eukprot:CAMPEP_0202978362 /NCGR_PEP_ID=MMETSP1396-20130829/84810_1 /ASSEMBLY_ACC=CAM_ASM_000872 /TAXON_ID= /ORGANISM="Pseudokeronopsis sp., Strain Brazil" /LENGTH=134 /DNA_ID=CAMNT_0049717307 /DNA_START=1663 /DNA_END=2067 /DNA_ORIENTATION=-
MFLLPVIKKAKASKAEVYLLFTSKKVEKTIDEQLKKCRWFITKYQQQNDNQQGAIFEQEVVDHAIEENTHIPEKEMKAEEDKQSEYYKNYSKKKKKWKELDQNFGIFSLRFLVVLVLIESFFLASYLLSKSFLQ